MIINSIKRVIVRGKSRVAAPAVVVVWYDSLEYIPDDSFAKSDNISTLEDMVLDI